MKDNTQYQVSGRILEYLQENPGRVPEVIKMIRGDPDIQPLDVLLALEVIENRCNAEIYSLVNGEQSCTEQSEGIRNSIAAGLNRAIGYISECRTKTGMEHLQKEMHK